MSKLPRAHNEKIRLAIIKQVKRLERRKKRTEARAAEGEDESLISGEDSQHTSTSRYAWRARVHEAMI